MKNAVSGQRSRPTSDPDPAFFDRAAGRMAYVDEGPRDAPAFFALPGIPGSVRDFRYLAPQLTDRLRLVRVDLPGFGASAPDEEAARSLRGRARAVLDLADHLRLERFGLIGHSMGGGPALLLAGSEGARISHLVLLASVGLSRHRGLGRSPAAFRLAARALALPLLGPLLARSARGFLGSEALRAREFSFHLRAIGALDFEELRRAADSPLPPALVVYSRDDPMLEPAIAEELARRIAGARTLAFDDAGHNLQKTRAPEVAAAVKALAGV